MSVPAEVMSQMQRQPPQAPGATPGAPGGAPGFLGQSKPMGPAGAPVSQPQDKRGTQAAALTNVQIAVSMLEQALSGLDTEHKQAILKALQALNGVVAKKDSSDLVPAEIMQMVRGMPQMGGGTDLQQQILAQMRQPSRPQAAQG